MKYRRIMIAIDNSDEAHKVIEAAIDASHPEAEFHLVTVVQPLSNIYGNMVWSPVASDTQSIEESIIGQSKIRLAEVCDTYNLPKDNNHVLLGSTASQIREAATNIKAELIVIGTHGRHGMGLIMGSTANSVLHGVNTDVLVIRL
ncbi:MAG: universal stress protein [Gammaproteobacteria bacterium]